MGHLAIVEIGRKTAYSESADEFVLWFRLQRTAEKHGEMSGRKPTFLLVRMPRSVRPGPVANHLFEAATMSLSLEQIRRTADRVAASHGLEVVEIEYLGSSKQRVLRVFIEQNQEQRARRAAEAAAAGAEPRLHLG